MINEYSKPRLRAGKRWTRIACAVLLFAGLTASAVGQQEAANGVVKILSKDGEGQEREGSGFVVGFGQGLTFIATASHVIEGDARPRVVFAASPHLTYEATPARLATESDVAVLKVVGLVSGIVALPFDQRPVEPTEAVQAVGFPRRALQPRWSTAAVSSTEEGKIVLDRDLAEGHSGGPLLRSGWVVGLVQATEQDYAYAMPAASVAQVLESWKVPIKQQVTEKYVVPYDPPPASQPSGPARPSRPIQTPQVKPSESRCFGTIRSLTGADQPIRISALPGATILRYLRTGTRVVVEEGFPSSEPKRYKVAFESMDGWIEGDQLELDQGCWR